MMTPAFALVIATLRRFASSVKPTLPVAFALTKLMITRSASCPWAASMVLTWTRLLLYPASCRVRSVCCPLYGVSTNTVGGCLYTLLMDCVEDVLHCVRLHSVARAATVVELLSAAMDVQHSVASVAFLREITRVLGA